MFAFFHFMFEHGTEHVGPRCNQYYIISAIYIIETDLLMYKLLLEYRIITQNSISNSNKG